MFRSPVIDAIVVIVVLLLIVGPKKLPQLGRGLGDGMREFKDGITGSGKGDDDDDAGKVSLTPVNEAPGSGAERPTQTAGPPRRDTGSEPRA